VYRLIPIFYVKYPIEFGIPPVQLRLSEDLHSYDSWVIPTLVQLLSTLANDILEIGFHLILHQKPTQIGPVDTATLYPVSETFCFK
jgi:hypothetical protein